MRLRSIRLHPFAGIANNKFSFATGLTAIFGPNEHGKSTVAKAIQCALFLETKMSPARKSSSLKNVMPIAGGDTIRITMELLWNDLELTLEKQWGATCSVKLQSSDGVTTTDDAAVQYQIAKMLPANQAVVEQVLIASQSRLADAISSVSHDVQTSLSEKLRSAILNGGGISGTHLDESIKAKNYFARWDEAAYRPEGGPGRGLSNPWRSGAGLIVEAWYKWQRAKTLENEIKHYETESNRLQTELNSSNDNLKKVNNFLEIHRAAYSAVNKRIAFDGQIQKFRNGLDGFAAEAIRWPIANAEKSFYEQTLARLNSELTALTKELIQARQKQDAQQDLSKLIQVNLLRQSIQDAETAFFACLNVSDDDLQLATKYNEEKNRCQALIDGQKLHFVIDGTVSGAIQTIHSGGKDETIDFKSDQRVERQVNGGVEFEWKGVKFNVQSANEDIATLEKSLLTTQAAIALLLKKYMQTTLEGMTSTAVQFNIAQQKLERANSNFHSALGNDLYEDLVSRCKIASSLPETRALSMLEKLHMDTNGVIGGHQANIKTLEREINILIEKHQSFENLDNRRINGKQALKETEAELMLLPPLPQGFHSALQFQDEYTCANLEKEGLSESKHKMELEIQALIVPQQTLGEAMEDATLKESYFLQMLAEGEAYRRIQVALKEILDLADTNAFEPLHLKTETYLDRLSGGRFNHIPFDVTQPQELKGDGIALPVSLLSKGTKDILALSLRLAAAEVYLESSCGFVMMDDPLVDMDRSRREAASEVLQEFSQHHQTIIFTCHEAHSEMLNCKTVSKT